ncbi:MAG: hypothetical protein HY815_12845 [Candidatus Riflebacteria bacterium]|nr:hypothetical protein [Candidatus Riflebacteria bacterium]
MKRLLCVLVLVMSVLTPPAWAEDESDDASPSPVPSVAPEKELEGLMTLFAKGQAADAFQQAVSFVHGMEESTPERPGTHRARLMLAKLEAIKKLLPQPVAGFDSAMGQLLYAIAQVLEQSGEVSESIRVYERLVKEYPKARFDGGDDTEPIATRARERIRWHREKHPWIHNDLDALVSKLRDAFSKHSKGDLAALIARIGFWAGPFQSEGGPEDPDRALKHLESVWPQAPIVVAAELEPFSDRTRQVFVKTTGWKGEHPHIYLIVEKVTGGWHWSALAFAKAEPEGEAQPGSEGKEEEAPGGPASPASSPSPTSSRAPAAAASPAAQPSASPRR